MRNVAKYVAIGLLAVGLTACDQKEDSTTANSNGANASQSTQNVTVMAGKMTFSLPAGMSDKSGKLGTQANNMHVYADDSGQRAIIVIDGDSTDETLPVLAQRLEQQQRSRDPQLQVVANKAITLQGLQAQQLDSVISANNATSWSSVVLAKVDGKLLTLQITLPANNQQQAQTEAEKVINTLALKQ